MKEEGIFLGISIEFAHCGCPNIKNSNNGFKKDDRKPKGCTKSLKVARGIVCSTTLEMRISLLKATTS